MSDDIGNFIFLYAKITLILFPVIHVTPLTICINIVTCGPQKNKPYTYYRLRVRTSEKMHTFEFFSLSFKHDRCKFIYRISGNHNEIREFLDILHISNNQAKQNIRFSVLCSGVRLYITLNF